MGKCPKCGGKTGIKYTRWEKFDCILTFDGEEDSNAMGIERTPKKGKCCNCGHPIEIMKIIRGDSNA